MLLQNKEKLLYAFLVLAILAGLFFRVWGLDAALLWRDEPIHFIAALKLNHAGFQLPEQYQGANIGDARNWHAEHPPIATFTMGLATRIIGADYTSVILLPRAYVYNYIASGILKETFLSMRFMSALFGVLVVAMVFLIARKLWETKAALWSAALASLSVDFVAISRVAFLEIFMIGYFLLALFFFLKYLEAEKSQHRAFFALLVFVFAVLTLGTRAGVPLLVFPVLMLPLLFIPKERKKTRQLAGFFLLLVFSFAVFYFVVNSPTAIERAGMVFREQLNNFFENNAFFVLASFFFKNSYFFLFGIIVSLAYFFKNFGFQSAKKFLLSPDKRVIVPVFLFCSIAFFSSTILGQSVRYFTIMFVPAMMLMGKPLQEYSKNRVVFSLLVFLVLLNIYSLFQYFPNHAGYANFGGKNFLVLDYNSPYELLPEQHEILRFLEEKGNPRIFTNLPNLLVFYRGEAHAVPSSFLNIDREACLQDWEQKTEKSYIVMLAFATDAKLFCTGLMQLPTRKINEFGLVYPDGKRFPFGTISVLEPI